VVQVAVKILKMLPLQVAWSSSAGWEVLRVNDTTHLTLQRLLPSNT
jgi:hypothetical protein